MLDSKNFIIAQGRHERVAVALYKVAYEVRDLIDQGYVCSGSMLHVTDKDPRDAFIQNIFIQPMVYWVKR